jgi:hypothetical protein
VRTDIAYCPYCCDRTVWHIHEVAYLTENFMCSWCRQIEHTLRYAPEMIEHLVDARACRVGEIVAAEENSGCSPVKRRAPDACDVRGSTPALFSRSERRVL